MREQKAEQPVAKRAKPAKRQTPQQKQRAPVSTEAEARTEAVCPWCGKSSTAFNRIYEYHRHVNRCQAKSPAAVGNQPEKPSPAPRGLSADLTGVDQEVSGALPQPAPAITAHTHTQPCHVRIEQIRLPIQPSTHSKCTGCYRLLCCFLKGSLLGPRRTQRQSCCPFRRLQACAANEHNMLLVPDGEYSSIRQASDSYRSQENVLL